MSHPAATDPSVPPSGPTLSPQHAAGDHRTQAGPTAALQQQEKGTREPRFTFVDGLRGLAALGVMLFHFCGHPLFREQPPQTLGWFHTVCLYGNLGVPVFFVISGFVIAHSIAGQRVTRAYFGNFVLRRVIRLDPPYWFAIAFAIGTTWLGNHLFPSQAKELPSVASVVAHMFYVFQILGFSPIEEVFWTLAHEVQFYLLFLTLTLLMQRWFGQKEGACTPNTWGALCLIAIPGIVSVLLPFSVRGLCLNTWYLFAMGALTYYWHRRYIGWWMPALLYAVVVGTLFNEFGSYRMAGLLTALAFLLASAVGRLHVWLSASPYQFFGRISYSLYLIHGMIGWRVLSVAHAKLDPSPNVARLCLVAAVVASIVAAWGMRRWIEVPSLKLASRLKLRKPAT